MSNVAEIPTDDIADIGDYKANSLWRLTLRRVLRQRSAQVGLVILGIVVIMAVFAPLIATHDPEEVLIGKEDVKKRQPPCIHALGCPDRRSEGSGSTGSPRTHVP